MAHLLADHRPEGLRNTQGESRVAERHPRLEHIHNFRGVAVLFIVATHTLSAFDWRASPELARGLKHLLANGTIFFLFLSGYLFQYLGAGAQPSKYWQAKLRNVALPYLVASIPALLLFTVVTHRPDLPASFYQQSVPAQMLDFLLTGRHLAPFWFIPTLLVFFFAAPALRVVFRPALAYWVLPLLFLAPIWFSRTPNALANLLHFLPIWVLGMAMARFRQFLEPLLMRALPGLVVVVLGLSWLEVEFAKGTHTYISYLQKTAMILALMGALMRPHPLPNRLLGPIAELSFGIFLVHSYIISLGKLGLERMGNGLPQGSLWAEVLAVLLVTGASALLVQGLRSALGRHSRMVVGV